MAIAQMTKMKLVGLTYHEDEILNALQKTECVELSEPEEVADTVVFSDPIAVAMLNDTYNQLDKAISFYEEQFDRAKTLKITRKGLIDNQAFPVSYEDFLDVEKRKNRIMQSLEWVENLEKEFALLKSKKIELNNTKNLLIPYLEINDKFSDFVSTKNTAVFYGTIKKENSDLVKSILQNIEDTSFSVLNEKSLCVVCVVALKTCDIATINKTLNEQGFVICPFGEDKAPKQKYDEIIKQLDTIEHNFNRITQKICDAVDKLKEIKLLYDYYGFLIEKKIDSEKFRHTGKTFVLQGYLPKGNEEEIKKELDKITNAFFIEFSEPTEVDNPPTLTVNNKIVKQAEFITDMYSVPSYREVDPNKPLFFFFMLFMGVIMADVGYGIIMIIGGLFLSSKIKRDSGAKRLWNVIAIDGVFTVVFGVLFNSCFGFSMYKGSILPSPIPDGSGTDDIMIVLLGCLTLGVLHIATGYFLKAMNCFKSKDITGGIFDGLIWVLFFCGAVFASFNFLLKYLLSDAGFEKISPSVRSFFDKMTLPGIIIVIATVAIAAFTAGRNEKGFGKFSKGFGAVYGLINLMSDILSYARLFGLMLSGMIIASTFNDIGLDLIRSGGFGVVGGPLVIVAGHAFNIAMGVLGAYIHDSRLQYIEFFSKFYTGEGEKFTPLGSQMKYIYLTKNADISAA